MSDFEISWNPKASTSEDDESCVHLHAYLSPKDEEAVVGYYSYSAQIFQDQVSFVKSPYGKPFIEAYHAALLFAENNGIPKLIVHDPDGLGQAALKEAG